MKTKNQKGITLVALIITIVVMMILVAVSVTVALRSGLFSATSKAARDTREKAEKENELAAGKVTVGGTEYNSMQEYIDTLGGSTGSGTGEMITFTLDSAKYTVKKGTKWAEFVEEQLITEPVFESNCEIGRHSSTYYWTFNSYGLLTRREACKCGYFDEFSAYVYTGRDKFGNPADFGVRVRNR